MAKLMRLGKYQHLYDHENGQINGIKIIAKLI